MINFTLNITSTFDWSIVVAIISAIVFFFGKLISEVTPQKENKYATYVSGFVFFSFFVIFPAIVFYSALSNGSESIPAEYWIGILLVLTWFLGKRFQNYQLTRIKLEDFVLKITDEKTRKIFNKNRLLQKLSYPDYVKDVYRKMFFDKLPTWLLLIFSLINLVSAFRIFEGFGYPLVLFFAGLVFIFNLSILAVFYSWNTVNKYPQVTIFLIDGKKIIGELTRIDSGYLTLIHENKTYSIPEHSLLFMEAEILTEEGKEKIYGKIKLADETALGNKQDSSRQPPN